MCGIFGAVNIERSFSDNDFKRFKELTDIVAYRGPDASGYLAEAKDGDHHFKVFLGHRRLSIIDLSDAGMQPMVFDGISIVFNGEIFNYVELREDLKKQGILFQTDTDTEVIIKTYLKYGEQGFSHFNGMWAFILYDSNNKKVVVSRDRFSIKPLYYLNQNGCFYFSSEIKQLTPLLIQKNINKRITYHFLKNSLLDQDDETFFQDILKLKPRHNLIIELDKNKVYTREYWQYNYSEVATKNIEETFRELFFDSINIRLRSDVKVGALLSGGLDSSAISVIADQLSGNQLESFSVISRDKKYSEEKFIDILINENKLKNKKLDFNADAVLESLDKVIFHQDEPFAGFSIVAQHLIFEKIKNETDVKVILSGQGGDEVLMGYLKYYFFNLKDNLKRGNLIEFSNQVFSAAVKGTVFNQFKLSFAKRYIPFMAKANPKHLLLAFESTNTWQFSSLKERQVMDIEKFSVPALAHYEDRNSMAFSIESRLPFLDHRLVEFLINVPVSYKLKDGWTKYLLRKSILEMPEKIRWRKDKQGFVNPEASWIRNELQPKVMSLFKNSVLAREGIIDEKLFLEEYSKFLKRRGALNEFDVIRLLIAEIWARRNFS
jgi:asparagine synthase (glutamine-hydrolysing)